MGRNQSNGKFNYNNIEKKGKNFMYDNFKNSNGYNCDLSAEESSATDRINVYKVVSSHFQATE